MRQSEKMREIKSNIVSRICELNKELYGYVYDKFTCDKMVSTYSLKVLEMLEKDLSDELHKRSSDSLKDVFNSTELGSVLYKELKLSEEKFASDLKELGSALETEFCKYFEVKVGGEWSIFSGLGFGELYSLWIDYVYGGYNMSMRFTFNTKEVLCMQNNSLVLGSEMLEFERKSVGVMEHIYGNKDVIFDDLCSIHKKFVGLYDELRSCHDEVASSYDDAFSEWIIMTNLKKN